MPRSSSTTKKKTKKEGLEPRTLERPDYRTFRLSKRIKQPKPPVLGSFRLFQRSLKTILGSWRLFGGISLVYFLLLIIVVRGLSVSVGAAEIKELLEALFTGESSQLATSVTVFGVLLGNISFSAGDAASVYQILFLVIFSLASIWALRQKHEAKKSQKITVRDAFYKGMYPFIPSLMVVAVIGLQLTPIYIAAFLYAVVFTTGIAVTAIEQVLWALLLLLLVLLSLYMLCSSIMAFYVSTLPDVKPMQALRFARGLVKFRRLTVLRRLLFLPVAILVLLAVIVIPLIIISPALAEWVFVWLTASVLIVVHSYLYHLYRELL